MEMSSEICRLILKWILNPECQDRHVLALSGGKWMDGKARTVNSCAFLLS